MAYSKYYSGGWKNNEDGNTPITAAALNHMESGIVSANVIVSTTTAGLMSAQDKSKLNGITAGASVTGIKGNAESSYRSGNVNLTAANIGALPSNTTYVSGVKGNSETTYRSGNVNITPVNIGAVAKSGDTMTGVLRKSSNLDYDTAPATNVSSEVLQGLDVYNHVRFRIYQGVNTNGSKYLYLMARDDDGTGNQSDYNQFGIGLTPDGEPLYSLGSSSGNAAKAFRRSISLGTNDGSLPIQVSQGGTGVTSNPSMLVNLGSTSAASVLQASPRPGITGTLSVAHGGTGATNVIAARQSLYAAPWLMISASSRANTCSTLVNNIKVGESAVVAMDGDSWNNLMGTSSSGRFMGIVNRVNDTSFAFFISGPAGIYRFNLNVSGTSFSSITGKKRLVMDDWS